MTELPPPLARLPELARNPWWSWHPEAGALFAALAPAGREPATATPSRSSLPAGLLPPARGARRRQEEVYERLDRAMAPVEPACVERALEATRAPTARLSASARRELVETFFDAHWHHQIYPHGRYRQLFEQRLEGRGFGDRFRCGHSGRKAEAALCRGQALAVEVGAVG